jgi:malate synthase
MPGSNQLGKKRLDVRIGQKELLEVHQGTRTEAGLRENIRVGVQYIEAWLRGRGAVPLYNLMEDAATAEISRAQIWQQLHFGAALEDGQKVTVALFEKCLAEEMERVKGEIGEGNYAAGRFPEAINLFRDMSTAATFEPFLTLPAYRLLA